MIASGLFFLCSSLIRRENSGYGCLFAVVSALTFSALIVGSELTSKCANCLAILATDRRPSGTSSAGINLAKQCIGRIDSALDARSIRCILAIACAAVEQRRKHL